MACTWTPSTLTVAMSPERVLLHSCDDEGRSDRETRRNWCRNGIEGIHRLGSSNLSKSSDQAVTPPPSHSDRRRSSSHRHDRSPNNSRRQLGEDTRGRQASRRDLTTTTISQDPQGRAIPRHKDPGLLELTASRRTARLTRCTALPSTIAPIVFVICRRSSRGFIDLRTNARWDASKRPS